MRVEKNFTSKMEIRIFRGYDAALIVTYSSEALGGRKMNKSHRFVLFNFGFWASLFNPNEFIWMIHQDLRGGFQILRREITFELR